MDNGLTVPSPPGDSQFTGELRRVPRCNPREFEDTPRRGGGRGMDWQGARGSGEGGGGGGIGGVGGMGMGQQHWQQDAHTGGAGGGGGGMGQQWQQNSPLGNRRVDQQFQPPPINYGAHEPT